MNVVRNNSQNYKIVDVVRINSLNYKIMMLLGTAD